MSSKERTFELLDQLMNSKKNLADTLVEKGEEASVTEPINALHEKAGNYVPKSYLFVDENGNEVTGVLVSQETIFDADVNDVREGKVFATETGVKTGEKFIPSYVVNEGYRLITNGSPFVIPISKLNAYDFTKLQVIICPFAKSVSGSVAAEKVVINDSVYPVKETAATATVTKDSENKQINLGYANDSGSLYLIRYFTYKEIY